MHHDQTRPRFVEDQVRFRHRVGQQKSLYVVVIGNIVTVPVHRPIQVFFEPMRMTVIGDHFEVIMDRLEHGRRMRERGHHGPDDQRKANKTCQ